MTGLQIGIFASFIGVGLGAASIVGYVRWRRWQRQLLVWQGFAASRGWYFMATPGFMYATGTMELKGSHAGRPFSVETEDRGRGQAFHFVTIVRHALGDGFPREVTIRPETAGDKVLKLFGVKDEELGDASLDAVLDLKNVTPQARAVLLGADLRRPLLNVARTFETFTIEDGVLTAEVPHVPRTTIELYGLLTPVRELAEAIRGASGHTVERAKREGQEGATP
ncbi:MULTISPECIES: hypothetical protein [unclassified Myxococcus]|uniref:hypothetical protein n=1 Tax=unclassified Myxococcus TaxID=2648731 RepID=UPI0020CE9E1F|nr:MULTISPECIES: hypothetical protein [unclassified Myxococcus]